VIEDWIKLYSEELHNLYTSPDVIKEDEMGRACSMHGQDAECTQGFGGTARRIDTTRKICTYLGG
jgi:hypothetical protein